jgi:hypothetical protein
VTREGMKVAKAKGWLRGKQPKWKPNQAKHLVELHDLGTYTQAEFASSSVSDGQRSTELWSACDLLRRNPSDPFVHLANRDRRLPADAVASKRRVAASIELGSPH